MVCSEVGKQLEGLLLSLLQYHKGGHTLCDNVDLSLRAELLAEMWLLGGSNPELQSLLQPAEFCLIIVNCRTI